MFLIFKNDFKGFNYYNCQNVTGITQNDILDCTAFWENGIEILCWGINLAY